MILDEKTAASMSAAMNKIKDNSSVHIKAEDWEKTEKKPQIVDLWCMFNKSDNHNNSSPKFPFNNITKHGVSFHGWGLIDAGKIAAIKIALDDMKVTYHTDED